MVVLVELRDELTLGGGEGGPSGFLAELALANAVVSGKPIPDGEIDGGGGGVAEVVNLIGSVDGELRRVNAVRVVESEGGHIACASGEDLALRGAESFEGAAQVGVIASGGGFDGGLVRERGELARLGEGVERARVGEEQDAEVEASFFCGEGRVVELALALLGGKVGFDDVGVGDFAAILKLVGEVDEGVGFVEGALGDVDFADCGEGREIRGDDAGDQIAAGAFEVGGGARSFLCKRPVSSLARERR